MPRTATLKKVASTETFPPPEVITRLKADVKKAGARALSEREARYLVDLYYQMQEMRKSSANQVRSMSADKEPTMLLDWAMKSFDTVENEIKKILDYYTDTEKSGMGAWAKEIVGIGPVIAAGLLAHIDIRECKTVGSIWRFAGLDPTSKWEKGHKRPWNAEFKVLCWKIGQSFEKVSNNEKDFYGKYYQARKADEWARNLRGELIDQANRGAARVDKSTQAYLWYSGRMSPSKVRKLLDEDPEALSTLKPSKKQVGDEIPMLNPGHIRQRALRWATKLFLCHWFEQAWRNHYKTEPPLIYSVAMMGHVHKIEPPKRKGRP